VTSGVATFGICGLSPYREYEPEGEKDAEDRTQDFGGDTPVLTIGDWQSDAKDSTDEKECPLCRLVPSRIDVLWHYVPSLL
jgi:hypothetical protein